MGKLKQYYIEYLTAEEFDYMSDDEFDFWLEKKLAWEEQYQLEKDDYEEALAAGK